MSAFHPLRSQRRAGETIGTASLLVRFRSQVFGRFALDKRRIVAVGLLTEYELSLLGQGFSRVWPVDETPCFVGLLEAIDDADRELWRERDRVVLPRIEN